MVFCGSGGMATVPPDDGGVEAVDGGAALGGGVIWLVSGCLAVAGVVAGVVVFFAFFDVVEGAALGVDAWAFFRHELRADALFWLWQLVEDLAFGVGVADGSSWANEGVANETAARAARPAIKRRMKITPGLLAEGDGTASIKSEILW
jgi:hypothetical protein